MVNKYGLQKFLRLTSVLFKETTTNAIIGDHFHISLSHSKGTTLTAASASVGTGSVMAAG